MPAGGLMVAGAIAQTGLGIAKSISGASEERRAKDEMSKLNTPFYKVQNEYFQNKNIAEAQAGQGMPSAEQNYITTENQRGLSSGLGAVTQSGGDVNSVANLFDKYSRATGATGAQSAQMHLDNIQKFMERSKDLAGQKTMQWTINEYQPYERKLKELKERIAAGEQNKWGGLSEAASGISAAGTGLQNVNKGGDNVTPNEYPGVIRGQQAILASQPLDVNKSINVADGISASDEADMFSRNLNRTSF